jgi:hypothetical protein
VRDLREILADSLDRDREHRLTMRELYEERRERDRDFHGSGRDRRIYTVQCVIDRTAMRDPELLDGARNRLVEQLERMTTTTGYQVAQVRWETDPPVDETDTVMLRLEASCVPRTDGEWPALHAALAEDERDREAAKRSAHGVHDRLDALSLSARYWGDPLLRGL